MSKYKIIFLETIYDTFETNPFVRDITTKLFKMKLTGYKRYHQDGIMPIASNDFFCNHMIICKENLNKELEPVAAFKSITSDACKRFKVKMPVVEHNFKGSEGEYPQHIKEVDEWIKSRTLQNQVVGYNFGWTVDPDIKDRSEKEEIKNLSYAAYYFYYNQYNIDHVITAAFVPFKVHEVQEYMGFDYLSVDNKKLSAFKSDIFHNKEAYIMHLDSMKFAKTFADNSMKYKNTWDERIAISAANNITEKKKAA